PLNTMERITLILPNNIVYKPGFHDSISIIKSIAAQLNTSIKALVIRDDIEIYEKAAKQARPSYKMTFESIESWDDFYDNHLNKTKATDLVIALSARRGTVAWHSELEVLPKKLA